MTLPNTDELQAARVELQQIHKEHVAVHNVKLPQLKHDANSAKSVWLAVLYHYMDREVRKDETKNRGVAKPRFLNSLYNCKIDW